MALERIKGSTLVRTLGEAAADAVDLLQKEIELARAELAENLKRKLRGGAWVSAGAMLALVATFALAQAAIFAIAASGVAMHWAGAIVAGVLGLAACAVAARGRHDLGAKLVPVRVIKQINQDFDMVRERLQ